MKREDKIESDALDELRRINDFEQRVLLEDNLPEVDIIAALHDRSESLRAEALDYIITRRPTPSLSNALIEASRSESAVQCVARLAFLSYAWSNTAITSKVAYRPTIDEADYIMVWVDAGIVFASNSISSIIRLLTHAYSSDWELSQLSKNLISLLKERNTDCELEINRVDNLLRNILMS